MAVDLDALQARLRRTADALAKAEPAAVPARPVEVAVIALPAPHRWFFVVQRDDQGRISGVMAEPVI